ncbi:MAG TPA: SDR family oxidoreductase [Candidatus Limnocylindria bacterium]|jgi:NAD(P)-dependent dehydrogenase (short-subunit alcohol dehydrogenase family)|nr:SDR family oxidoreductase [Candidatus Limnocylindria bacterium]
MNSLDTLPFPRFAEQETSAPPEPTAPPAVVEESPDYIPTGKLQGKVAIISGGTTGIGKATAILFAKEEADLCLAYLDDDLAAQETARRIRELGRRVVLLSGDIGDPAFCQRVIEHTLMAFGRIDILVNNAACQKELAGIEDLVPEQVRRTFETNLFGVFNLSRAVLPHLHRGASIINTSSGQAYDPLPSLMDYACTKAALLNFTVSLAKQVAPRGIRVNAVAPGPIWTPMTLASLAPAHLSEFGTDTLLGRAGHPAEVAPSFVFLASERDSSYITGQVLRPNGGHH